MTIQFDEGSVNPRVRPGPALHFASAMPKERRAILGMVPGYADHGSRYAHVMGALAEHGIGAVVIDLRGHGRSAGPRGFCHRFREFEDDARELRELVEARGKGLPKFLFGHSFGGLVATTSTLAEPAKPAWRGLVLSAPFFGLGLEVPRVKVVAGKVASRLYPKLSLPTGLRGEEMTHDLRKAREYDADPLVFKNATARWFTETTAAQRAALDGAYRLATPLYVTFGTADEVASIGAGKRFFDAAGSADKTWDPREGLRHEVLNEPSWKDSVEAIARWIIDRAD